MLGKCIYVFILLITTISLPAQIIKTVAGSTCGYSGDGGPATSAQIIGDYYCYPAFDNAGNMYLAESGVNTIRRVDAVTGVITTIAGTFNVIGYTGDGGPAANALLYHPYSLAIDDAGNIYFTDQTATVIRMINPAGIITTVSGPYATSCVVGDGGPVSGARFEAISAITTDHNGNLYISDFGCNVIRKVNAAGIITTVAGNGTWGFSGDLGLATSAQLAYPFKVAVDNNGNIYIPDAQNHRIRRVDAVTGIITTVAGNGVRGYTGDGGQATGAEIAFPGSVVLDNAGNFYFGDYNMVVRKVDPSGNITTYAGNGIPGYTGDGGLAQNAEINLTEGLIKTDNNGNIYFINYSNCVIREIPTCANPLRINHTPVHNQICIAGTASFSIIVANAGSFLWQVNDGTGWKPLADDAVYAGSNSSQLTVSASNASLNGYLFRCSATNPCGTLNSIPDTLTILTAAPPAVSINASVGTICTGTPVTFTALPFRGGNGPQYQWIKNGMAVGTNAPLYSDNTLNNNDQISCVLTSNSNCITTTQATSNNIVMVVNPVLQSTISIQPAVLDICKGSIVNFTSTISNAGPGPSYQWLKNGMAVGSNSALYADAVLNNNDQISCLLTGNYNCPLTPSSASNVVSAIVHAIISPSVSINTASTQICPGTPAIFNASTTNSTTVQYQWMKNTAAVGTDASSFLDNAVTQGDVYACKIIATGFCLSSPTAISNTIQMKLFNPAPVSLDQNPVLCVNSNRILDAGNFAGYLWNDGSILSTLLVADTGLYWVQVTDKNACMASDSVHIDAFAPIPGNFLSADTSICAYESLIVKAPSGYMNYVWNDNTSGPALTIKQPGLYYVEVTDDNNCKGADSILVSTKKCASGFHIPSGFTPNKDGANDLFRPLLYGNLVKYKFAIYNRWGQIIFESSDPSKGWDGNFNGGPQDTSAYVWFCIYQFSGEPPKSEKGTVVLIR
jgi:gliding motility-associated-like protein